MPALMVEAPLSSKTVLEEFIVATFVTVVVEERKLKTKLRTIRSLE